MASRPWSADELALLEAHADDPCWLTAVRADIDRSVAAMKKKRAELRADLGLCDGRRGRAGEGWSMDCPEAYAATVAAAAARLRDATLRVGVWA